MTSKHDREDIPKHYVLWEAFQGDLRSLGWNVVSDDEDFILPCSKITTQYVRNIFKDTPKRKH